MTKLGNANDVILEVRERHRKNSLGTTESIYTDWQAVNREKMKVFRKLLRYSTKIPFIVFYIMKTWTVIAILNTYAFKKNVSFVQIRTNCLKHFTKNLDFDFFKNSAAVFHDFECTSRRFLFLNC